VAILQGGDAPPRRLVVPGAPVWALGFGANGAELLTGGSDGVVRRWNARTGEPVAPVAGRSAAPALAAVPPPPGTERGAAVFQACAACHSLTPDGGNRAGPSLHGVFGRRVGALPGYAFSPALKTMDVVWSADTIDRLFAIGPSRYTPGTKMPEQTVSTDDRRELVRFLEAATRPER
jgi:cytochrome c